MTKQGDKVKRVRAKPGEKVIGRGKPIDTVYRVADGRTVVRPTASQHQP